MIEKIKEALKKAGLDEGLADKIKVTDETEIEGAVAKLKKTQEMLELLKDKDLLDAFNAETDRRITKALDTFKKNLDEKQPKKDDKKADKKEVEKETDTSLEAFQKLLDDKLSPFMQTVKTLQAKDRESTIKARLKNAGLPENFTKFVTADTDDALTQEIEGLKTQYLESVQSQIDAKIKAGEYVPSQGKAGESVTVDRIKTYAKSREKAGNYGNVEQPFTGAKLNIDKD